MYIINSIPESNRIDYDATYVTNYILHYYYYLNLLAQVFHYSVLAIQTFLKIICFGTGCHDFVL